MKHKNSSRNALISSTVSLLLCLSMLVGTTFAWFTDSVTSGSNIIQSGNLDIEMCWAEGNTNPENTAWADASTGTIFNYDNWEPGYVEAKHIQIANVGSLAFKYALHIVPSGVVGELADVIDVYFVEGATQLTRSELATMAPIGTLRDLISNMDGAAHGVLLPNNEVATNEYERVGQATVTIAFKMRESAGNEYMNKSISTDFSVVLLATQYTYEEDSFGIDYDENAMYPEEVKDGTALIGDKYYATLQDAVKDAQDGDTIQLLKDISLNSAVKIAAGKTITLDLNGKTVDGTGKTRIAIMSYGNLTLQDTSSGQMGCIKAGIGTGGNAVNICAGTFTMKSGNIYSLNNAILIDEEAAEVTIEGGNITAEPSTTNSAAFYISSTSNTVVNITAGNIVGYNGILLWNNTTLTITGGRIDAPGGVGIKGNGTKDNTNIKISNNASINAKETAIYHPQGGILEISENAKLTGETGVVIKGGKITISGGTINGTGATGAYIPTGNGFNPTGDALYIEHYDNSTNSDNYGTPVVTVTGGIFTSTNGKAVASYVKPNANIEALTGFISGGTFSDAVPEELCVDGYTSVYNGNGTYSVQ